MVTFLVYKFVSGHLGLLKDMLIITFWRVMLFKLLFTELESGILWAYLIWIWGCFLVIATLLTESLSLPDWMVHANRWLFSPLFGHQCWRDLAENKRSVQNNFASSSIIVACFFGGSGVLRSRVMALTSFSLLYLKTSHRKSALNNAWKNKSRSRIRIE